MSSQTASAAALTEKSALPIAAPQPAARIRLRSFVPSPKASVSSIGIPSAAQSEQSASPLLAAAMFSSMFEGTEVLTATSGKSAGRVSSSFFLARMSRKCIWAFCTLPPSARR